MAEAHWAEAERVEDGKDLRHWYRACKKMVEAMKTLEDLAGHSHYAVRGWPPPGCRRAFDWSVRYGSRRDSFGLWTMRL